MMFEAMRRSFIGLGFTAIASFVFLTIFTVQGLEVPVAMVWKNMLGSMLMGIYFGCASLIYDIEDWSPLKQTVTHFFISLTLWIPLAIMIGWLPLQVIPITVGVTSFIITYLIFWYGIQFYLKKLEKEMNQSVKR